MINLSNILFKLRAVSSATPYLDEDMPFSEEEWVDCSAELTPITNDLGSLTSSRAFVFLGTWLHDVFINKRITINLDFDIANPAPFNAMLGDNEASSFVPEGTIINDMQEFKQWTTMEYVPNWGCCFTGANKRLMAKHWVLRTPEGLPAGEDKFPLTLVSQQSDGFLYLDKTACEIRTYLCSLSLQQSSHELLSIRTALINQLKPLVTHKPPDIRPYTPEEIQGETYEDKCRYIGETLLNDLNPAVFLLYIYQMIQGYFYQRNVKLLETQIRLYMAIISDGRLTGCCEWYGDIKYPVDPTPAAPAPKPEQPRPWPVQGPQRPEGWRARQ